MSEKNFPNDEQALAEIARFHLGARPEQYHWEEWEIGLDHDEILSNSMFARRFFAAGVLHGESKRNSKRDWIEEGQRNDLSAKDKEIAELRAAHNAFVEEVSALKLRHFNACAASESVFGGYESSECHPHCPVAARESALNSLELARAQAGSEGTAG